MSTRDIRELYEWLHLHFPGYKLDPAAEDVFVEDLADVADARGVGMEALRQAGRRCLDENPSHVPHGRAIRRQILEDAGLLAPSWPEALALAADVHHGRKRAADVPGPVLVIDSDALHAAYTKSWEVAYEAEARAHDGRVLAPGGIAELIAAAEWLAAARWKAERLRLAQQCASADPGIALLPGPATPLVALEAIIARHELESGAPAELAAPLEPGERLPDGSAAPKVAAMLARVRSLAAKGGE